MAVPPPTNITTRTFISGITWYWKVPIRNEHNTITHDTTDDANHPTGSTKLTFQGQTTTGTMDRFTDAAGVQALLESLSNIAPGDVSVTGGPLNTDDIDVEFTGAYAGTNVVKISLTAATNEFATNVQVWGTPDTEQLQPSFDVHHFQAQLWEDEVEGAGTLLRTDEWIVGSEFTYPTTGYATDYLFRVRSVSPNGEFSEWAGASPANPDEGGVGPQGNQGNQGYQGNQAADTLIYYIKPLDGTAIKNGTGTLNIEAHKIQGGVDSALVSGTIKLRNEANADWGYSKAVSAADIDESQVVTLKDGVGGTPLDTITLVDIADGGVAGYIEPSASLSWTRASDQTTWTPSTSTVDLDCTFVKAGVEVARLARRVTRAADGSLTVADTPHKAPGGDLQDGGYAEATYFPTDWATVPTQVLTVHYTYDDGTFTSAVAETVIASKAGAEGNQGTQGNQGNLGNQGNQGNQGNLGNQGTQGNQGNQGTPVTLYYIKPTNGTAIQNHTGSLTVEAHKIEGGVDSILSSGTIKLHEDTTELGTGYSATLTEAEISGAIVVTLKDGPSGTPLDTITLVDVADGTPPTSWTANMSSGMEMISPSHFRKASGGAYAEQVYSSEGYTTNVYLSASLEAVGVTGLPFIGLDENPTQDANYTNIDYAWHCGNSGNTWYVYESGSLIDAYGGTPTANDVVSILYDGEYIRYLFNGAEVRKVARAVGNKLYLDSSFSRDGNYGWDNIAYGPNPSGTNAVYGYITATNGLAWTRAADQSTWTPSASATDLVCTFVKGGTTIATRTWEVSRSANGILTGLTNGASGDSVTVTEINEGTQAFTVKFTHDNSGVSVSETVMTSMAGSQGNQGNQGSQGNTGNQGNQGGTGNQGNQGSQGNQGNQGNQGTLGLSVFYGAVYRRSDTQGTAPSNGTYNFADGTLTPPTGGTGGAWYVVPPVPDGKALWVTRATVTAPAGTTGTFGTWSTPARAISDGQTPSASPTPAVKEGIGYLLATWNAVANADPVWFEVHISTSTSFSGTEPGNGTWVASTPATSYAFKALADGTPLEYSTDYYIKVTEHDEDGSSTTPASYVGPYQMKLATSDDIDVGTINASAITADSMTGVSIDAATIAGSTIRTGDAPSPRVELDSTGLVVYDGSGAGPGNQGIRIVDIPTNNLDAAVFKTRLETPGGSIEGDMVLKDPGNIKVWATTSVTAPTVAPTVSPYWPSFLMSYSIGRKGSFWDTAGGTYGKIYTIGDESQPFIMSYNVTASGYPPTSSYDQRVQLATNYAGTGIVKAGSYLWTLEKNSSTGKWYIKSRNINTGYTTTGWQVEVTSLIPTQGFLPGLGYDGTYVCLLTRSSGGYVLVRKYSVSTNTLSYQSGQSYTTDTTHPNNAGGVSGLVTTGGYDWISYRSYYSSVIPYTVVPGTSGTAQSTKIFYSKDGATPSGGLCWDGTRFWTTALDYYMHQHSTVEYGSTDTPYFAYTWYKDAANLLTRDANDYETTGSPIGSGGTWPNRSFISVTTPGIPGAANAIALFGKIATSTPTLASLIAQPASSEGIQAVGETGAIFETLSTDTNDEYADLNGARQEFPEDYNFALNSDGTGRWDHLVPVGTIQMYAGSSLPDGWLWCDGTTFSQTSYPDLATVVGDTYGTHSGDNYYKPDLLGRFPLGAGGGTPNKSLGTGHDAATTHTHDSHTQNTNTSAGGAADRLSAPVTHSSYESPYLAINFIIKHD